MKQIRFSLNIVIPLLAMLPAANAQTVTGSLTGTVVDPGGAVVAGANVQLTNEVTKQVREFNTQANGTFIFPDLFPGGLRPQSNSRRVQDIHPECNYHRNAGEGRYSYRAGLK